MTDDLTARLERALHVQEQQEAGLHPDAAAVADLHARVARGRRGRATSYAAVAAAVAGVIGVAGWFGLPDRTAPQPAETETPSPTAPASPTPEPSPTPDAQVTTAPAPEPVSLPGLPPMLRAPEGILDGTGKGWFVVSYASGLYEVPPGDGERRTLALSAPTGELFHLTDVTTHGVTPVRWSDTGTVRAAAWDAQGRWAASVDLRTGEVTVDPRLPAGSTWVGMAGDDELWVVFRPPGVGNDLHVVPPDGEVRVLPVGLTRRLVLGPDGRTLAGATADGTLETVDVVTGDGTPLAQPPGQDCTLVGWLDRTGVMAVCVDSAPPNGAGYWYWDQHGGQVVRLDVTGGAPQRLAPTDTDGVVPWIGAYVRDGVVLTTAAPLLSGSGDCYDFCYGDAYLWSDGQADPLTLDEEDRVCGARTSGGGLLLRTGDLCYEEATGAQWWLVDETTRAARLVAPAVESDLGLGAQEVVERS